MNIGISLWNMGGLPTAVDPAADALFARMTTQPNDPRKSYINGVVVGLKAAGVWDKIDALWIMAAHDAQAARLNWKGATYTLTEVNNPTFTVDRGYNGDGTTSYLDTGYSAAGSTLFLQDNNSHGAWINQSVATTRQDYGTTENGVIPQTNTNGIGYLSSSGNTIFVAGPVTGLGFTSLSRSSATSFESYLNGTNTGTRSRGTVAQTTDTFFIGGRNTGGALTNPTTRRVSAVFAGSALNTSEMGALYNALNTYMTGVGAA